MVDKYEKLSNFMIEELGFLKCAGSVIFCYGSGSAPRTTNPDPAPDTALFASDLPIFFGSLLFEGTFTSFFKDKKS
jgi:hypothetical protein